MRVEALFKMEEVKYKYCGDLQLLLHIILEKIDKIEGICFRGVES